MTISTEQLSITYVSVDDLKVDEELKNELPRPTNYESTRESIENYGIRVPLIVDEDNLILDGHNRLEIAQDLDIKTVPVIVFPVNGDGSWRKTLIRMANFDRGHFSQAQLVQAFASSLLRIEEDKAGKRAQEGRLEGAAMGGKAGGKGRSKDDEPHSLGGQPSTKAIEADQSKDEAKREKARKKEEGLAKTRVARLLGMGRKGLETTMKVLAAAPAELKKKLLCNEMSVKGAANEIERDRKNAEREKLLKKAPLVRDATIIIGDFRKVGHKIADESVDLLFTDPPYHEEHIPLYGDLAALGARVLKPGGSLIAYAGHYALPRILSLMEEHLRYWWINCCRHSAGSARLPGKWVFVGWKPLVWFVKDGRRDKKYVADTVNSKPDKDHHEWGQGVVDAKYYIEKLTAPGELVLDPFCGGGTTAIAAVELKRRCTLFEIEKKTAVEARKRVRAHFAN